MCLFARSSAGSSEVGAGLGFDSAFSSCQTMFPFILEKQFSLVATLDLMPESVCVCVCVCSWINRGWDRAASSIRCCSSINRVSGEISSSIDC